MIGAGIGAGGWAREGSGRGVGRVPICRVPWGQHVAIERVGAHFMRGPVGLGSAADTGSLVVPHVGWEVGERVVLFWTKGYTSSWP